MKTINVVLGSITNHPVDVIVNAANSSLLGGGGVDGAIHRAAGKELLFACRLLEGCKTGNAKITDAFNITTAKRIVHTVGPVYKGNPPEIAATLLASCYRNSLDLARNYDSVAFPAISTGIYGYPIVEATQVALTTIKEWFEENKDSPLSRVDLMAYNVSEYDAIKEQIQLAE
jgi:O-acetyl-ADP-ribose deacetylase (regulator of RNase III)